MPSHEQVTENELQRRNAKRVEIEQDKLLLERYLEQLGALYDELEAKDALAPRLNKQSTEQLDDLADALGATRSLQEPAVRILNPLRSVVASWLRRTRNARTKKFCLAAHALLACEEPRTVFSSPLPRPPAGGLEEANDTTMWRGTFGTPKPGGLLANAFDLRTKNLVPLFFQADPFSATLRPVPFTASHSELDDLRLTEKYHRGRRTPT